MVITFDPLQHGLFRSLLDSTGMFLNTAAWSRAQGAGEFVGTCRVCGGDVVPLPSHTSGKTTWYSARCVEPNCLHEITMPNGAVLRRSSTHSEMPQGFWDKKTGKA